MCYDVIKIHMYILNKMNTLGMVPTTRATSAKFTTASSTEVTETPEETPPAEETASGTSAPILNYLSNRRPVESSQYFGLPIIIMRSKSDLSSNINLFVISYVVVYLINYTHFL